MIETTMFELQSISVESRKFANDGAIQHSEIFRFGDDAFPEAESRVEVRGTDDEVLQLLMELGQRTKPLTHLKFEFDILNKKIYDSLLKVTEEIDWRNVRTLSMCWAKGVMRSSECRLPMNKDQLYATRRAGRLFSHVLERILERQPPLKDLELDFDWGPKALSLLSTVCVTNLRINSVGGTFPKGDLVKMFSGFSVGHLVILFQCFSQASIEYYEMELILHRLVELHNDFKCSLRFSCNGEKHELDLEHLVPVRLANAAKNKSA